MAPVWELTGAARSWVNGQREMEGVPWCGFPWAVVGLALPGSERMQSLLSDHTGGSTT